MGDSYNNKVLLLAFHMSKALSVRYLANSLLKNGFEPYIVFLKSNVYDVQHLTDTEIELLKDFIKKEDFLYVGVSILTSFILSDVDKVVDMIKSDFNLPIVIGGAFPTIMPEHCAAKGDVVMCGESEKTIVSFSKAIQSGSDWKDLPGLCYFDKNGKYCQNDLAPLVEDLDEIAYPVIDYKNMYLIENNALKQGDPQMDTFFYEISCSRGCPFSCSFCCSVNIRRMYQGKGKYLRFRSVDSVIKELKEAVQKNPDIKEIRFWDEVFSNKDGWVEKFAQKYKKEIGLPFHIWGHPLMVKEDVIRLLADAGLQRIVVGIQSGSPNVRNNIFNRPESNDQIIKASKIISSYKIPEVYYDLMICHPLETLKEIKETFDLCLQLEPPFNLEIHGLSFLPGSDILNIAVEKGIYSKKELEDMFYVSYEEHIRQVYDVRYYEIEHKKEIWADLIFLTQFNSIRKSVINLSRNPYKNEKKIHSLKVKMENKIKNTSKQDSLSSRFKKFLVTVFKNTGKRL